MHAQLMESAEVERDEAHRCRVRLEHLAGLGGPPKDGALGWNAARMDRILADHMLRAGHLDSALQLAKEAHIEAQPFPAALRPLFTSQRTFALTLHLLKNMRACAAPWETSYYAASCRCSVCQCHGHGWCPGLGRRLERGFTEPWQFCVTCWCGLMGEHACSGSRVWWPRCRTWWTRMCSWRRRTCWTA